MKLYSTNNPNHIVTLRQAVLQSLPSDNGLYMPKNIPSLSEKVMSNLSEFSFAELANKISYNFLKEEVPENVIKEIVTDSINFDAPVITIEERISILELFHGPTLAFKDFGARFMARLMNYFWSGEDGKLRILVATSGDTGGAVAAGFHGLEHIEVVILFPKGKVSQLQEKQLTTWGKNIRAIEVEGDFDECQKMVKTAFLDDELNNKMNLSSANSINIARLIPQSFYYFEALKQLKRNLQVSFCVPSGNFGNLTAGLLAKKMGLPVNHLIAGTNINDVFPQYLRTGNYNPHKAHTTLSNAMDIGNPSNFSRIMDIYGSTWNQIKEDISGYSFSDKETVKQIESTHQHQGYVLDPHTAVGVLAAKSYLRDNKGHVIVLSTAHPIKFKSELEDKLSFTIPYPASIHKFLEKESEKVKLPAIYQAFKKYLIDLD